jgi:hypothetical protein
LESLRKVFVFFFIGGVQPKTVKADRQARTCPACSHMSLRLKRVDHYLSLFFIPLFPVKRGIPFLACEDCGATFREDGTSWEDRHLREKRLCPRCGRPLALDFVYCPYCGKTL